MLCYISVPKCEMKGTNMLIRSHRRREQAGRKVLSIQRYLDIERLFLLLVLDREFQ